MHWAKLNSWAKRISAAKRSFSANENLVEHQHQSFALSVPSARLSSRLALSPISHSRAKREGRAKRSDLEAAAIPEEESQSSEASSSFPIVEHSHLDPSEDYIMAEEPRRLHDVPSVEELMNLDAVFLLKNTPLMKSITWEINPGKISMNHPRNQFNRDQGGPSTRPPQQGPSLYDRTTKLEETLAHFMQVSMSNQKSTESAIKNLEVQVGQLAKQLKNPKEECKAVMTRSRMAIQRDDSEARKKMEEHKQQLAPKPALEPMASRKRKAPSTPTQVRLERSRFTSQEAWERYTDIIVPRKFLPERNVVDEELTDFRDGNIDVAIVKELYANPYDLEDKSPKQVRVRGHLIKFDEDTLNTFLKTSVIVEEGESLCAYSRFALLRPDPQELAAKLCVPGRGFELNADGKPLKILWKNITTLAQTWSVLSFSNLIPTSHTSDVTLDKAIPIYGIIMKMDMNAGYLISHQISLTTQDDTSRLAFPTLITTLCKARRVQSGSRSLESLSLTINLAYIKKNCWNLDDPIVTFRGPKKARGKRYEALSTAP
ncbi:hypothetical protein HKD37_02G004383 [Glycine soja]